MTVFNWQPVNRMVTEKSSLRLNERSLLLYNSLPPVGCAATIENAAITAAPNSVYMGIRLKRRQLLYSPMSLST